MPLFVCESGAKNPIHSRNTLAACWLMFNHTGTWVVGTRQEYESQTWVFSSCAHNRKCTLPVHLEKDKTPTKLLFVKLKAILCVNMWCRDKKIGLYYDSHAKYLENSCVAELPARLLETCRQDWDSFIYIYCQTAIHSSQRQNFGLLYFCGHHVSGNIGWVSTCLI